MIHFLRTKQPTQSRIVRRLALIALTLAAALIAWSGATYAQTSTTVNVVMDEWNLTPDVGFVEAGDVTFVATNTGERSHEFVVIATGLAADALPTDDDGERVLEDQLNVVGRIPRFGSGQTRTATMALAPGSYTLICNLENHYTRGQRFGFVVTVVGAEAPDALPGTGSGGLADDSKGGLPPAIAGLMAAAAVIALSGVVRIVRRGRS